MEHPKRAAVDAELQHLPEAVLHHIQSFLTGSEASQTSLVCKSWYNAWLTRPRLDLHLPGYQTRDEKSLEFATKTIQRYEDLKLTIESFYLRMDSYSTCHSLAEKLIVKAVKLGVVNLQIWSDASFILPNLESETLTELALTRCQVYLEGMKCSTLRYLRLVDALFLNFASFGIGDVYRLDLSSNLPCLTRLNLENCRGYKHIQIRSSSLQFINLHDIHGGRTAEFDVPNIQMFKSEGPVSGIKFKNPPPRIWKSDITIQCEKVSPSWFSSLNQLLRDLRGSISLTVDFYHRLEEEESFHGNVYVEETGPVAVVEKLKLLDLELMPPTFFDGLFLSCRPNSILHRHWFPYNVEQNRALRRLKGIMVGLHDHDLDEVNVEIFEEKVREWRSLSWETLLDPSEYPKEERMIRFQLKWRAKPM